MGDEEPRQKLCIVEHIILRSSLFEMSKFLTSAPTLLVLRSDGIPYGTPLRNHHQVKSPWTCICLLCRHFVNSCMWDYLQRIRPCPNPGFTLLTTTTMIKHELGEMWPRQNTLESLCTRSHHSTVRFLLGGGRLNHLTPQSWHFLMVHFWHYKTKGTLQT